MLDNEQVEQDVESGESSAPETSEKSDKEASEVVQTAPEKEVPFHEHPRFKELVEQKNKFAETNKQYEQRLKEMQDKIESFTKSKAEPTPQMKLVERLKGIDPEFGSFAEQQANALEKMQALEAQIKRMNHHNYLNAATAEAAKARNELKVDDTLHKLYMENIPMGTPVEKVGEMYRGMHAKLEGIMAARERAALSKYTEAKKADAKSTQQPLPAPKSSQKPKSKQSKDVFSRDREEAKSQIVSSVMQRFRGNQP